MGLLALNKLSSAKQAKLFRCCLLNIKTQRRCKNHNGVTSVLKQPVFSQPFSPELPLIYERCRVKWEVYYWIPCCAGVYHHADIIPAVPLQSSFALPLDLICSAVILWPWIWFSLDQMCFTKLKKLIILVVRKEKRERVMDGETE